MTTGHLQHQRTTATFNGNVLRADAALKGFSIFFSNGDHHIVEQQIEAFVESVRGGVVVVGVNFLWRDSSGEIDDPFGGSVDVVVIADVT